MKEIGAEGRATAVSAFESAGLREALVLTRHASIVERAQMRMEQVQDGQQLASRCSLASIQRSTSRLRLKQASQRHARTP